MVNTSTVTSAHFENGFWLQIMGDHARFILGALGPAQKDDIAAALSFKNSFDELLEQTKATPPNAELITISQRAEKLVDQFRAFKLDLLNRLITVDIQFNLPPTFINHMLNELEAYMEILSYLSQGDDPPLKSPLEYHVLWLRDASGHAAAITSQLDEVEKDTQFKAKFFEQQFQQLLNKAEELEGYLRTDLEDFPALDRFNMQADILMNQFRDFLAMIEKRRIDKELLGTISPLIPDHMLREECYYLTKLSMVSLVPSPGCDPTKPRINIVYK